MDPSERQLPMPPAPEDDSLELILLDEATAQFERQRQQEAEALASRHGGADILAVPFAAAGTGAIKSLFETYDFIAGESPWEQKSGVRQSIERMDDDLGRGWALTGGITSDISQFITGFAGLTKITAPIRGIQSLAKAGKAGKVAVEVGKGAAVSAGAFDPHEARLSNIIQRYPALQNPVSQYLAADADDTDAEGRLKNALENIGMDLAVGSAFVLTLKALRAARGGDDAAAEAFLSDAMRDLPPPLPMEPARPRLVPQPAEQSPIPGTKADLSTPTPERPAPEVPDAPASARLDSDVLTTRGTTTTTTIPEQRVNVDGKEPRGGPRTVEGPEVPAPLETAASESPWAVESPSNPLPPRQTQAAFDDAEIGAILKAADADTKAIAEAGSREAAEAGGYKFAKELLPWRKLSGSAQVRTLMERVAEAREAEFARAKGGARMSDREVELIADRYAQLAGMDGPVVFNMLRTAGDDARTLAARMEAGYSIANQVFADADDLVRRIDNGVLDAFGGDRAAAVADLKHRLLVGAEVLAATRSITANVGRALRRHRFVARPLSALDAQALASMPDDVMMEMIRKAEGDPERLAQAMTPSTWDRVARLGQDVMMNGVLSFYPSHFFNFLGSAALSFQRPVEKYLGSYLQRGGSAIRRQARFEMIFTKSQFLDIQEVLASAQEAFMRGDSILRPHDVQMSGLRGSSVRLEARSLKDPGAWGYYGAVAIGLPTRALGAADEMFKLIRYRAFVQARAAVAAEDMGLTGEAFTKHVKQALDDAFGPDGRALDPEAYREAQIVTFTDPFDGTGQGSRVARSFEGLVNQSPWMRIPFTFVRTPLKVLSYGSRMTPGLNLLHGQLRDDIRGLNGVERQAQAMGQVMIGSAITTFGAMLAADGMLTGGGPDNPEQFKALTATGWKPYSLKIGDTYLPIGRVDPMGLALSIGADAYEMMHLPDRSGSVDSAMDFMAVGVTALAKSALSRTMLTSVKQLVRFLSEPDKSGERYVGRTLANFVPMSALLRGTNPDPYLREGRTLLDQMRKDFWGSGNLPPVRDTWGDPVRAQRGITGTRKNDKLAEVDLEMERLITATGRGPAAPDPVRGGVDLRDITLKDGRNAFDAYQEFAGYPMGHPSLKEAALKLIRSQAYQDAVDGYQEVRGTRLWMLSKLVAEYRKHGFKTLRAKHPEIGAALQRRRLESIGADMEKRWEEQGTLPSRTVRDEFERLREGLDQLGIPIPPLNIPQGQ